MRQALAVVGVMLASVMVYAGNAHFVGVPSIQQSGNEVVFSGKVAGLGNVPQIHVTVTGDAQCVNRGNNKPQASNKQTVSASGDFPVQNGKSLFALELEAVFQPSCQPPMSVEWSNLSVTVTADDGTFLQYP